ncbi:MAG: hypothetical protein N2255_01755, partial [Kiritimatiellae bacterium]|nr:hypothetical protein [Kiritimatiellia bacterium]
MHRRKQRLRAVGTLVIFGTVLMISYWSVAQEQMVLSGLSYWRRYYRFGDNPYSAALLRAEGEKILGANRLAQLRDLNQKRLQILGTGPTSGDWYESAYQPMGPPRTALSLMPPPPDNWMQPDFDDSSWIRQRGWFQGHDAMHIMTPNLGQFEEAVDLRLQAAYYRARFLVKDRIPPQSLTLWAEFTGGIRVFLNGREVVRSHLPTGRLDDGLLAEPYPAEAYRPGETGLCKRTLGPLALDAQSLVKGINLLAVEVRASPFHPIVATNPRQPNWSSPQRPWPHARLFNLELRTASPQVVGINRRPDGVQVWVEDIHHLTKSDDFLPIGELTGSVRLTGARNGTYGAKVVIRTDRPLTGYKVECSDLVLQGGTNRIPQSAFRVAPMVPFPRTMWTMERLGDERGLNASFPSQEELRKYVETRDPRTVQIFDQITRRPVAGLSPHTVQPVWISLRIPSDAAS